MSTTQIAWAAGFFDGEGCVFIQAARNGKYIHQGLLVVVTSTTPAPLRRLYELFGGSVSKPYIGRSGARPARRWLVTGRLALAALKSMLPYLTVKRLQAKIALRYPIGFRGHRGGVPEVVKSYRNNLRNQLKSAKCRKPFECSWVSGQLSTR